MKLDCYSNSWKVTCTCGLHGPLKETEDEAKAAWKTIKVPTNLLKDIRAFQLKYQIPDDVMVDFLLVVGEYILRRYSK